MFNELLHEGYATVVPGSATVCFDSPLHVAVAFRMPAFHADFTNALKFEPNHAGSPACASDDGQRDALTARDGHNAC